MFIDAGLAVQDKAMIPVQCTCTVFAPHALSVEFETKSTLYAKDTQYGREVFAPDLYKCASRRATSLRKSVLFLITRCDFQNLCIATTFTPPPSSIMQQGTFSDESFEDGFNLGFAYGYQHKEAEDEKMEVEAAEAKFDRLQADLHILQSCVTRLEDRMALCVRQPIPSELHTAKADLDHNRALLAAA